MLFFVINRKKLSPHMDQISEYINFSNHRIHSYDKMRNMIVNLGSKKGKNNNNHSPQLTRIHNSLLITIVDTHENYLSNIEGKYDMTQVRTSSVKPSSTLFLCSVRAMYNIINKKTLMLKSYIPGIDSMIGPKRNYYPPLTKN